MLATLTGDRPTRCKLSFMSYALRSDRVAIFGQSRLSRSTEEGQQDSLKRLWFAATMEVNSEPDTNGYDDEYIKLTGPYFTNTMPGGDAR